MKKSIAIVAIGLLAASAFVISPPQVNSAVAVTGPSVAVDFTHQVSTSSNLMFGLSAWPKLNAEYAQQLADAGVTIIRSDIYLYDLIPSRAVYNQNPSSWNWNPANPTETTSENDLNTFTAAGTQHVLVVHGIPEWMGTAGSSPSWNGQDDSLPVTDFGALENAYKQVFAHYLNRVNYFEVGNEPDLQMAYGDYAQIYKSALAGMDQVSTTTPVGGPVTATEDPTWFSNMLANSTISSDVRFGDWHSYGTDWGSNASAWQNAAASAGKSNLPLLVTEYNHSAGTTPDSLNSTSPQAISFLGYRLSAMMDAGVTGAMLFGTDDEPGTFDEGQTRNLFTIVNSDGSFTPKVATIRLLSKDLGLGVGQNTIMNTADSGVSTSSSAINAAGQDVAWVVNDTSKAVTSSLTLQNTGLTGSVHLTHYIASASNTAMNPALNETKSVSSGTVATTITMPAYSIYGVVMSPASSSPFAGLPGKVSSFDYTGSDLTTGRFVATSTGTANKVQAQIAASGSGHLSAAVYADENGAPGALLSQTTQLTGFSSGTNILDLKTPISVTGGTAYWIAIWSDDTSLKVNAITSAGNGRYVTVPYGVWPASLPALTQNGCTYDLTITN